MTRVLVHAYDVKRDHLDAHDVEALMLPEIVDKPMWVPELGREDLLYHRLFLAEKWLVLKLSLRHADPRDAGVGNIVNCGAAMYIAPVGIANAGDPQRCLHEAIDLSGAHQSSYGREAAGVLAPAWPRRSAGATVDDVVEAALALAKDGDAHVDRGGGRHRRRSWTAGARAASRSSGARSRPSTRSASTTPQPAQNARIPSRLHAIEELPSRSGCSSRPAATTPRPCSGASTTAATRTRSRRWAARSRVRSAAARQSRASGSRRSPRRAASTSRRPVGEMAAIAVEIFERDVRRHERRARAVEGLTAGEVPA
jgi:hypothetical protein